jgi:hypothetical protein
VQPKQTKPLVFWKVLICEISWTFAEEPSLVTNKYIWGMLKLGGPGGKIPRTFGGVVLDKQIICTPYIVAILSQMAIGFGEDLAT